MSSTIFILVLWILIGILNIISNARGDECRWLTYWLCYAVLIIELVGNVLEEAGI